MHANINTCMHIYMCINRSHKAQARQADLYMYSKTRFAMHNCIFSTNHTTICPNTGHPSSHMVVWFVKKMQLCIAKLDCSRTKILPRVQLNHLTLSPTEAAVLTQRVPIKGVKFKLYTIFFLDTSFSIFRHAFGAVQTSSGSTTTACSDIHACTRAQPYL